MEELRDLRHQVYDKVKGTYPKNGALKFHEIIMDHVNFLLKSRPTTMDELKQYAAFHVFTGSTVSYNETPLFDLPEDLSIVKFLREKLAELNK